MSNPYLAYQVRPKFGEWWDEAVSSLEQSIAVAQKGGKKGDKEAKHLLQSIEEGKPLRPPEKPKFYKTTVFKMGLVGSGILAMALVYMKRPRELL
jgi:hypothetical protein